MDTKRQNSPSLIDNVQILHSDYTTVKLGYNELGYNELPVITNIKS
jgi:hypothetical protein